MESNNLRAHTFRTYLNIRFGLSLLAIFLPLVLWLGGLLLQGLPLQASMSAYYHAGDGVMRDVFVGVLITVGAFLYLYKGFTNLENIALNLAGVFLVGVALFPMEWNCGDSCAKFSLHGSFAVLFFLSIAYVCVFRASDTLSLIQDEVKIKRHKAVYRWLGLGMVISPALALILTWLLQPNSEIASWVFFVEATAVIMFGLYWYIKSCEIDITNSELRAIEGKLKVRRLHLSEALKQLSVDQVVSPSR